MAHERGGKAADLPGQHEQEPEGPEEGARRAGGEDPRPRLKGEGARALKHEAPGGELFSPGAFSIVFCTCYSFTVCCTERRLSALGGSALLRVWARPLPEREKKKKK